MPAKNLTQLIDDIGKALPDWQKSFFAKIHAENLPQSVQNIINGCTLQICIWDNEDKGTSITGSTFFKLLKPFGEIEDLDDLCYGNKERRSEDFYNEVIDDIKTRYPYVVCSEYVQGKSLLSVKKEQFDSDYSVMWFVEFESAPGLRDEYVWQLSLDAMAKYVQNIDVLFEPDELVIQDFDFMDHYQKYIFRKNAFLPDFAHVIEIAFLPYERRQNKASVCFVSGEQLDEIAEKGKIVKILKDSLPEKGMLDKNNLKFVRKLLETCANSDRCLLAEKCEKNSEVCGILQKADVLEGMKGIFSLMFEGNGSWRLLYDRKVILAYHMGTFVIDEEMKQNDFSQKLSKIQELKDGNKIELFIKILGKMDELPHGGLMIIAGDAEDEAKALCEDARRGVRIEPLNLSDDDNLDLFYGMSSIDGAALVDFDGCCHGFGVILDGKAQVKGDMGKGARHNSAGNYIFGKQRYAVVRSEDKEKEIEVYCPDDFELAPIDHSKR